MSAITVDLAMEAVLSTGPDGRIHLFWRDGHSREIHETYPCLSTALMRIAVLERMAAHNMYCTHNLPERFTKHAETYLSKMTRSRSQPLRPWSTAWRPARRFLRTFVRSQPLSNS